MDPMSFQQGMRIQFKTLSLQMALKLHKNSQAWSKETDWDGKRLVAEAQEIFNFLEFELHEKGYTVV